MPKPRFIAFLLCGGLPFALMVAVNEWPGTPDPTADYQPDRCTRYCHDHGCPHWEASYAEAPTAGKRLHRQVFDAYVRGLHGNPLRLDYRSVNLLVFLLAYPLLGGFLLWNLLKPRLHA